MAQSFTALHREREYLLSVLQNTNAKTVKLVKQLAQAERKLEHHLALSQTSHQSIQTHQDHLDSHPSRPHNANKVPEKRLAKAIKQQKSRCKKYRGLVKVTEAQEKAILNSLSRVSWSIQAKERWIAAAEAQMTQFLPPGSGEAWDTDKIGAGRSVDGWWHDGSHCQQQGLPQYYPAANEPICQPLGGFQGNSTSSDFSSCWTGQSSPYGDQSTYPQIICSDSISLRKLDEAMLPAIDLHAYQQGLESPMAAKPSTSSQENHPDPSTLNMDDLAASVASYFPFATSHEQRNFSNLANMPNCGLPRLLTSELSGPGRRASEANWLRSPGSTVDKPRTGSLPMTLLEAPKIETEQTHVNETGYMGYGISNGQLGCVYEE